MNKIIIFSSKYLDSHTSYFHQEADSYQNNGKAVDADGKEYETIAPLFIGFNSNVINQRFDIKPAKNFSMYAGGSYSYKLTDRPDSRTDITGGSDYDMRSEGWRWEAGAKYKFGKHSLLLDLVNDNYHYGNLYQVATKTYDVGDFVRNKFQKYYEAELKGVFHFYDKATTIIGADWRNDFLTAKSGDVRPSHRHSFAESCPLFTGQNACSRTKGEFRKIKQTFLRYAKESGRIIMFWFSALLVLF